MIASRRSTLALTQSRYVQALLERLEPRLEVTIHEVVTSGDKILDSPLSQIGDRGLFVKEIEEALLAGDADLAVHSAKDVPTALPEGLALLAFPEREDPADVFVGRLSSADELGPGRVVGTSSLRRRSQLLARYPGLEIVDIRGNVETRIRKIEEEGIDGTILAAAGLKRLGRFAEAAFVFPDHVMLSAVGQGSLAIEARADDEFVGGLLARLDHPQTRVEVLAERALMRSLEGGCQVPIGGRARVEEGVLVLAAFVGTTDGRRTVRMERSGPIGEPEALGEALAAEMLAAGADAILGEVRGGAL
ncbi:MAG: hydroxymethylbilane synthase [Thermoleophilia bacterium]